MSWLFAMLPTFVLVALLSAGELLLRPGSADWWRNLQAWGLNAFAAFAFLPLFMTLHLPSLSDGLAMPVWVSALAYLVVRDGLEFLFHRAQHTIPWLWAMHSLHHSDPNMSALTTSRHFWGDAIIKALTIYPLAAFVIAPTPLAFGLFSLLSLWNFAVHARLPINFGPLSWLLNSPAYHRRHHSSLPEHYNSNFAALFPIFDVLSGTYNRPHGFPPTGLDTKPESLADLLIWPVRMMRGSEQVGVIET
jgi:sterol desaturase/sphingolipid hydroxylase (fatty acid hydroxylase superfamily)